MEKKYFLMADIHGDWRPIRHFYQEQPYTLNKTDNTLILLGDTGLNFFFNRRDKEIKKKLGKYPFTYFIVRGNHEERPSVCAEKNPDAWHKEILFENEVWVENNYPYIKYALDEGGTYIINNKKVLILPGAFSPDKWYRLQMGWSYFENEQMNEEEKNNIINNLEKQYDYIFAHTCPLYFYPFIQDLFLSQIDQSKIDKTTERWLNQIVENTKYERFYFGHYHDNRNIEPYKATMIYHQPLELGYKYGQY